MLTIRMAEPSDAAEVAAIYAPVVTETAISFELSPPAPEEMARRIRATLEHAPWLVLSRSGELLGYAYAAKHNERAAYLWSVNVSVYVRESARGQGVGRALYASLLALLTRQGFYTAHAGITLPNAASVALHEAMGFRPIGVYRAVGYKLGAWRDVGWWQLALREREGEPAPPLSLREAAARPGFEAALAAGLKPPGP